MLQRYFKDTGQRAGLQSVLPEIPDDELAGEAQLITHLKKKTKDKDIYNPLIETPVHLLTDLTQRRIYFVEGCSFGLI